MSTTAGTCWSRLLLWGVRHFIAEQRRCVKGRRDPIDRVPRGGEGQTSERVHMCPPPAPWDAINEESQRSGSSPAIAARAMLNRYIQQRELLAVSEARIRQLEELILLRAVAHEAPIATPVVEPDVAVIEELVTDVSANADEALDAWGE